MAFLKETLTMTTGQFGAGEEAGIVFEDVVALRATDLGLKCRLQERAVFVGLLQMLEGTTVRRAGDVGRLIIPRRALQDLGLTEPAERARAGVSANPVATGARWGVAL
jgi:hypothetical protein